MGEPVDMLGFGAVVEVIGAEVVVEGSVLQHVIGGGQDRSDGTNRLFCPAAGAQAMKLGLEVALLLAGASPSTLDEGGLEPRDSFAHPGGAPLALGPQPTGLTRGALVV